MRGLLPPPNIHRICTFGRLGACQNRTVPLVLVGVLFAMMLLSLPAPGFLRGVSSRLIRRAFCAIRAGPRVTAPRNTIIAFSRTPLKVLVLGCCYQESAIANRCENAV